MCVRAEKRTFVECVCRQFIIGEPCQLCIHSKGLFSGIPTCARMVANSINGSCQTVQIAARHMLLRKCLVTPCIMPHHSHGLVNEKYFSDNVKRNRVIFLVLFIPEPPPVRFVVTFTLVDAIVSITVNTY